MNTLKKIKLKFFFILLFAAAFIVRLQGINWDNGFHFHPDERMLIMVADRVRLFSRMDPAFFNYGSLPIYILVGVSQFLELFTSAAIVNYDMMLYVGRFLSVINEMVVLFLIYKITVLLFEKKSIAYIATFFYAFAFFPIQNAHFFISDTFLNLFSTLLLYLLLLYYKHSTFKKIILIGVVFAAAITTKVTALVFLPIIFLVFFIKNHGKFLHRSIHTIKNSIIFAVIAGFFSFLFMPYAFIKWEIFLHDISLQLQMNSDPYIFPYTLQYVGTLPYLYYLKNIAIWGVGPIIFGFFLLGIYEKFEKFHVSKIKSLFKHIDSSVIFFLFYIIYFLAVGRSAVKFMRYMLPLYPFFTIMAAYGLHKLVVGLPGRRKQIIIGITILGVFVWCMAFLNINSLPNTRIQATKWINKYIHEGSVLAVEHWDDRVPIFDTGKYPFEELTLYDRPDDDVKWDRINTTLQRADYIIIASNRLYTPLQKLNDCEKYQFCFPKTDQYYKNLLGGASEFQKVVEFTSYPYIPLGPWKLEIIDDGADESFTVYDHPKIMIFRKGASYSQKSFE